MDKPDIESIWHYPYFKRAVLWPAGIAALAAGYVIVGDVLITGKLSWAGLAGGSEALALFWQHFKVPLAVLSLAVPLGAWAIADLRSKEMQRSLNHQRAMLTHQERVFKAQEEKRELDLYWNQLNHLTKMVSELTKRNKHTISESEVYITLNALFGTTRIKWPLNCNEELLTDISDCFTSIGRMTKELYEYIELRYGTKDIKTAWQQNPSDIVDKISFEPWPYNIMSYHLGWVGKDKSTDKSKIMLETMKCASIFDAIRPLLYRDHRSTWPHIPSEMLLRIQELYVVAKRIEEYHQHSDVIA